MSEAPIENPSFEEALMRLEQTVRELEDGRLGLEDALLRYEQGIQLIRFCHGRLQQAEQRILQLTGVGSEGEPTLQPFQHEATMPAAPTNRRRTS
jgi:exodeoxyribonuclease VII small subunit